MLKNWSAKWQNDEKFIVRTVCCDTNVHNKKQTLEDSAGVSVDARHKVFLKVMGRFGFPAGPVADDNIHLVFCTYQSAKKLSDAQRRIRSSDHWFDLAIFDEAHRTAVKSKERTSKFQVALKDNDEDGVNIRRRYL